MPKYFRRDKPLTTYGYSKKLPFAMPEDHLKQTLFKPPITSNSKQKSSTVPKEYPNDTFFNICSTGNLSQLQALLKDPFKALCAMEPDTKLRAAFQKAAALGHACITTALFAFAQQEGINIRILITRASILAAIACESEGVFKSFLAVMSECVNFDLGPYGHPLTRVLDSAGDHTCERKKGKSAYCDHKFDFIRFLLENGAEPGDHLVLAIRYTSPRTIRLLLRYGAKVANTGALHEAARLDRRDTLESLYWHVTDLNEQLPEEYRENRENRDEGDDEDRENRAGNTPLHEVIASGKTNAVIWLLEHGAHAGVRNNNDLTPVLYALLHGREVVWELLQMHKLKIGATWED